MKRIALLLALCLIAAQTVLAADCPTNIQEMIQSAVENCSNLEINEACYGGGAVELETRADDLVFEDVGDRVDAAALTSVELISDEDALSIVVLRPRANLPENALTMIAFGNVTLQNDTDTSADFLARYVRINYREGVIVRGEPSQEAENIGLLNFGAEVLALGISEDGTWVYVRGDSVSGWVVAQYIDADFDLTLLEVTTGDVAEDAVSPFQRITFASEVLDAPCSGASDSGVLVQSPNFMGDTDALLIVDGVGEIYFTGTLYLSGGEPNQPTIVSVLEGEALVTVTQGLRTIHTGEQLAIPVEPNVEAGLNEAYVYYRAGFLPLNLLPRLFELPFSLGGLIESFVPGTGFLDSIGVDDACTVVWTVDVNLRLGPGTEFPIRQGVAANYSAHPDGRATGTDGLLWWRLAEEVWLNSESTLAAGACGSLPILEVPPAEG